MPTVNAQPVRQTNSKKSRRRKKRRTAQSSDSDASSSESESSAGELNVSDSKDEMQLDEETSDVELSETEIDRFKADTANLRELDDTTRDKLSDISLTVTDLTRRGTDQGSGSGGGVDLKKVSQVINTSRERLQSSVLAGNNPSTGDANSLQNEYLNLLFENYGDDITKFRDAPDFTSKSLVVLANVLKEGSNMFDTKTLKTILDSK